VTRRRKVLGAVAALLGACAEEGAYLARPPVVPAHPAISCPEGFKPYLFGGVHWCIDASERPCKGAGTFLGYNRELYPGPDFTVCLELRAPSIVD
jgi:hypothetical protein